MSVAIPVDPVGKANAVSVERASDRELVVTRTFQAPAHVVYDAWTKPELFRRWWAPQSFGVSIISCELDVRAGGGYHLVMSHPSSDKPMSFFGKYIEVEPGRRIAWTNDEGENGGAVTTVTFEETTGTTLVTVRDVFPSKEALEEAVASGSTSGWREQFEQLAESLLASLP